MEAKMSNTLKPDLSNATELPPAENAKLIRAYASGLGQFARWQTAREMHADLERAVRSDR